jgi:hypothetical protein
MINDLPIRDRDWLAQEMLDQKMFWSYDVKSPEQIPDPLLIETVLLYGDIVHLNVLFRVFEKAQIKKVLEENIICQKRFHDIANFIAWLYFDIEDTQQYISEKFQEHNPYERIKREYAGSF